MASSIAEVPPPHFLITEIDARDWQKIHTDLKCIELMTNLAKSRNCRLIISGGYAVDGNLGRITRPHRDIDMQIFGQVSNGVDVVNELIASLKTAESEFKDVELQVKERQTYYQSFFAKGHGLGADIYFIQVAGHPFNEDKYVVKQDGTLTEKQTYGAVQVTLEGTAFEAINPTSELVDKRYKREVRGDPPKPGHDQDMFNLSLITDADAVHSELQHLIQ